jgi:hypothetical protein
MGLDLVELVLSVEEKFGIELPDEDAARLRTPRQLIEYVCSKVAAVDPSACASQRSFNRVRRILAAATKVKKRAVRPATHLEDLLSAQVRRRVWPGLAREIGVARKLTRPPWLTMAAVAVCGVVFVGVASATKEYAFAYASAGAAVVGLVLAVVTRPAATRLDLSVGTLALEAIPAMVAMNSTSGNRWTRDAVAETCRVLIREVSPRVGDFSDDDDFINDLGMG